MTRAIVLAAFVAAGAAPALAQVPNPAAAINAAKDARAKTEAAQKKNADALNPPGTQGSPGSPGSPGSQGSQSSQGSGAQPAKPGAAGGAGYSYDPGGRRDPFVSLTGRGAEVTPVGSGRPSGLPGVLVNEVTLKGVFKSSKGAFIALLQTPDNKTYIVHPGDKVMDGSVKTITQDAVVFSQDVNDPLSLVKQREVRKTLRPETR
jgi:hypothetical protein